MSEHKLLGRAIAVLEANSELIYTKDGITYSDLIGWLKELQERRKADGNEYAMNLIREQWEDD